MMVIFVFIAVLSGPSSLSDEPPNLPKIGENFTIARARLYAEGWHADPGAHAGSGEYFGVDRVLIQSGYDEVDFCSTGKTFCTFQYIKDNTCLQLQTQGEEIEAMKVQHWSSTCREEAPEENQQVLPADIRYLSQWYKDCEEFGQCHGFDSYFRKLEKKYKNNSALSELLVNYKKLSRQAH